MTESDGLIAPAPGVISVTGADADTFLRAQLTNDVMRLGPDRHFLAAWCDAKGRAILVARIVRITHGYLLILPRLLLESTVKRLRMYVLRSKVVIEEVTASYRLDGLIADHLPPANRTDDARGRLYLGLPTGSDAPARALVLSPPVAQAPADAVDVESARWQMSEIDAGIPTLFPPTQGQFVPQMLNLHWLQAIDFDKGCYPGQEVIARLHYRGRLTRSLFRLAWTGKHAPAPGEDVTDTSDRKQGTIIRAAASMQDPSAGRLLAVLRHDSLSATLRAGGVSLDILDLPYPTPR